MESDIVYIALFIIVMLILFFVIRAAIDSSVMSENIAEIRKMLSQQQNGEQVQTGEPGKTQSFWAPGACPKEGDAVQGTQEADR